MLTAEFGLFGFGQASSTIAWRTGSPQTTETTSFPIQAPRKAVVRSFLASVPGLFMGCSSFRYIGPGSRIGRFKSFSINSLAS